ncbi:unnamed protein product [Chondrus crispus]|uniref:Amidohydrolase-related domain-containing protein n=1 Tax=Chondrus crispus TaxID=2769 RepID=R7Q9R3_CHOCR|nr:unnamed protein product [Chondrus crispus]CDF34131.1 unnamed protein product [Chondrus crispus]|eukprot:XP_005713950.1 unnamed protein product [Chondrus crispus]
MDAFPPPSDTLSALEAIADATLLFDNHAHPFHLPNPKTHLPRLRALLTEAAPPHPSSTLAFYRSLRDIYRLLAAESPPSSSSSTRDTSSIGYPNEAPPQVAHPHAPDTQSETETIVEETRARIGVWPLAERCFSAAGIAAVLLDDGLHVPRGVRAVSLEEVTTRLNIPVAKRVLRIEKEAELALADVIRENEYQAWSRAPREPPSHTGTEKRPRNAMRARQFRAALTARLCPLPEGVVALKSIAAYRGGLDLDLEGGDEELEEALAGVRGERIEDRVIVACVVRMGLEVARQYKVPLQIHCGFGDTDLDLGRANPVLLKSVVERYPDVDIVLLHAAWPYTREAAHMAAVHPGVYLDLGLAIPLLSVRGMFRAVDAALEIAPVAKLLYSSDAHSAPDVFYLAARWGRRVIAAAVAAAVTSGDLDLSEAKSAIRMILAENAVRLYRLPVTV